MLLCKVREEAALLPLRGTQLVLATDTRVSGKPAMHGILKTSSTKLRRLRWRPRRKTMGIQTLILHRLGTRGTITNNASKRFLSWKHGVVSPEGCSCSHDTGAVRKWYEQNRGCLRSRKGGSLGQRVCRLSKRYEYIAGASTLDRFGQRCLHTGGECMK